VRLLTFLSDFGNGSPYPAAMKAVAAGLCDACLIDISHDVRPGSIREGAFLLWSLAPACAAGTVHCAVVDPGVGTARAALAVASGDQILVGPDNGLLLPAARRLGAPVVYRLRDAGMWRHPVSATFHGRDVFAPTAARLAAGAPLAAVGARVAEYVDLQFPVGRRDGAVLVGEVLWIDHFGNLVTNIPGNFLEPVPRGSEVVIEAASTTLGAVSAGTFADVAPGKMVVLVGSDGLVEVAQNGGSAAAAFSAAFGMPLRVRPA
jgi:S-adenosyl-L-methionine hydrolase (adenosine-forming)